MLQLLETLTIVAMTMLMACRSRTSVALCRTQSSLRMQTGAPTGAVRRFHVLSRANRVADTPCDVSKAWEMPTDRIRSQTIQSQPVGGQRWRAQSSSTFSMSFARPYSTDDEIPVFSLASSEEEYLTPTPSQGVVDGQGSFRHFPLRKEIVEALKEGNITQPTHVQTRAFPALLGRRDDVMIAAQTGTGKTLSYLVPVVERLKEVEERDNEAYQAMVQDMDGASSPPPMKDRRRRPRALVLVPSRELAVQTLHVAKLLAHHVKFVSSLAEGGGQKKHQRKALNREVDLLIATPQRLAEHMLKENVKLSQIQDVIVDELDMMCHEEMWDDVMTILGPLLRKRIAMPDFSIRFIFVGAAVPGPAKKLMDKHFPNMKHVSSDSLHKPLATTQQEFVRVAPSNKLAYLEHFLQSDVTHRQVMVFCNTVPSCSAVVHHLKEADIPAEGFSGGFGPEARRKALKDFREGNLRVLVCTDVAAHGLDIPNVDQVILYDFPFTAMDYLHRVGRTGRVGREGHVLSLVTKKEKEFAKEIENYNRSRSERYPGAPEAEKGLRSRQSGRRDSRGDSRGGDRRNSRGDRRDPRQTGHRSRDPSEKRRGGGRW